MKRRLRDQLPGLRPALAVIALAFAAGVAPPASGNVARWAEQHRFVAAESGSPLPGKWRNDVVPFMVEVMECLTPTPGVREPIREVTLMKSHQVAGSECAINLIGYVIDQAPAPVLVTLPSLEDVKDFVRDKLEPTFNETPCLRAKVRDVKSRDETGSTTFTKRFRGGLCKLTTASSSKGLKGRSVRILIADEITEYPFDVDNQGDPLDLAEYRTTAWSEKCKKFYVSTPGIKGRCRIAAKYERSDQRRYYVPCPSCGVYQVLSFAHLVKEGQDAGSYACQAHGCIVGHQHKREMIAAGVWIKTYPGDDDTNPAPPATIEPADIARWRERPSAGRPTGFHINQLYSPFVSWADTLQKWLEAQGNPTKEKAFVNQVEGETWEEKGEAPAFEKLFERRESYRVGIIPPGGLFLTAAVDVQGNRLEFAVYAWGAGLTSWLIDRGVIAGDPQTELPWGALEERLINREYEDTKGRRFRVDAIGVDSGYLSHRVYAFCRRHAIDTATRSTRVFALDGRPGWKLPPIGTGKKVDVDYAGRKMGTTVLWPVGTWDLKAELYKALEWTVEGPSPVTGLWRPGAAHFPDACDQEFFKQLTAEFLKSDPKPNGLDKQEWVKTGPNEAHDIAVYARALARHLSDQMQPHEWAALAARRAAEPEQAQQDLAAYWSASLVPKRADEAAPALPPADQPRVIDRSAGQTIVRQTVYRE